MEVFYTSAIIKYLRNKKISIEFKIMKNASTSLHAVCILNAQSSALINLYNFCN